MYFFSVYLNSKLHILQSKRAGNYLHRVKKNFLTGSNLENLHVQHCARCIIHITSLISTAILLDKYYQSHSTDKKVEDWKCCLGSQSWLEWVSVLETCCPFHKNPQCFREWFSPASLRSQIHISQSSIFKKRYTGFLKVRQAALFRGRY